MELVFPNHQFSGATLGGYRISPTNFVRLPVLTGLLRTKEVATYCRASHDSSRRWSRDLSVPKVCQFFDQKKREVHHDSNPQKSTCLKFSHLFLVNKKTTNYMKFPIPRLIEGQQKKEEVQPRFKSYQPTGAKMQPHHFSPTP